MTKPGRIKEAIILAGGKGTRLREVVFDIPKPMAPVGGIPFIQYQLDYLIDQKIERVVLAVGFKHEVIIEYFGRSYKSLSLVYSIEEKALGTGGAIKKALGNVRGQAAYVLNGDTYFPIDLDHLKLAKGICAIAALYMKQANRYGTLQTSGNLVEGFQEKGEVKAGIINGGIYRLKKEIVAEIPDGNVSFETSILPKLCQSANVTYQVFKNYFIDIGIPKDYYKFQTYMSKTAFKSLPIDSSWTLFLDRDGVINERLIDDYVKQLNELSIIEGVPAAISLFTKLFQRIVVVTNQQGIGKGMMTADDLAVVHGYIAEVIEQAGGQIDQFYFAPQLAAEKSNDRKPGTGMGLQAKKEFPEIDFKKSIMIGDSESDIEFGMKLGMKTIMLKNGRNLRSKADYIFENLHEVSKAL